MRGSILILILAVGIAGLATKPAQACTCAAPAGPAEGLKRSTAVFTGKVTEISRPFLDRLGLTKSGGHRVKFEVLKQWKGTASKSIELITRLSGKACGFPFEEKKEYLIYVVTEPKDLQTGICTGTKNLSEAVEAMKELDKLISSQKK